MGRSTERSDTKGRVLLVDDDAPVLASMARYLKRDGFEVGTCGDGAAALSEVRTGGYDVVVTDITMPGMDGIALLRGIREQDRDLPVVLITGVPAIDSAAEAVELGAFRYLTKPVDPEQLLKAVIRATQLYRLGQAKRMALSVLGNTSGEGSDRSGLAASFKRALDSMWIAYQPIVDATDRSVLGYEALLRSDEPSLPHPGAVLDAAERLGELDTLGRAIRRRAAEPMLEGDPTWLLFLNLHPEDLLDENLLDGATALSRIAERVVLEITERASLDKIPDARARVTALRALGFRIAVDDLGAGYAGLTSFVHLEPDFVKLDMSLIRDVDASAVKRKLVASMTSLCKDMGLQVVAEGIETAAERDTLLEIGCDLFQGYRFAKPSRPFVQPAW